MTPHEYIQRIEHLVASGDDRGALDLSARHHRTLGQHLTDEELLYVGGLLESAAMAVDLAGAAGAVGAGSAAAPIGASVAQDAATAI